MTSLGDPFRTYSVQAAAKQPLLEFITRALHESGCQLLHVSPPKQAPFRITFKTPEGEHLGIIVYAFLANHVTTKNRPTDEHRFQVKYGSKDGREHELWQDPYGLYTTLFVGIDPERQIFVGADPIFHSPTKMFISVEFKRRHVEEIKALGWHAWERESRGDEPVEVLVGGTRSSFLRYVRFEREALGEDQGHRHLIAETSGQERRAIATKGGGSLLVPTQPELHRLAHELALPEREVLDLIEGAPRLKMAVRGWVAEEHLFRSLVTMKRVSSCERLRQEGGADIQLRYDGIPLTVECKNVLRTTAAKGVPRMDFQRTRSSKSDPCSRYYSTRDFDVVAACLHAVTERWEFKYADTQQLDGHAKCTTKLANNVRIDQRWTADAATAFERAAQQKNS